MKKRICAALMMVLLAASLFGFSQKSVGLTDSDVEAFISNYNEINTLLNESIALELDEDMASMSMSEVMALIPASTSRNISKELNKLGISGLNALEKTLTITYGVGYSYIKAFYELLKMFAPDEDDGSMEEVEALFAFYESFLAEADLDIIGTHFDELAVVTGLDSDTNSSISDDYDWSDYDWDDDYDYDWSDYGWDDGEYGYEWGDDDYEYDWDNYDYDYDYDWGYYGWDDGEYGYEWGDDDYEYDWDDYDWSDYDWSDYFTEEEELESEAGVAFLKELIPSLSPQSGTSDFLYKTIKPGTYTKVKETDQNAFMFQKDWAGSKYPSLTISDFCISMSYEDPNDPDADWDDEVYKYFPIDATTELYKATIRGTVYYERVIKTKQYGTIRIWVDATNLGEGEDVYYSSDVYAVLSIGDFIIEGTAIVAAG